MELIEDHKSSSSSKGSGMDVDYPFPIKPQSSKMGKAVSIYSNFN